MLQVARLAPRLLGESAGLVTDFLRGQIHPEGGFKDRSGDRDLYYTVFGLEGLAALRADVPWSRMIDYVRGFGVGEGLDFVHLTCLARAWANLPATVRGEAPRKEILAQVEALRSADGGYDAEPGRERGTLYGCFLALGAYQDLETPMPRPEAMLACIRSLRAEDGGYANQVEMPLGLTPSTAAAATLLRQLGAPAEPELAEWLLARCHPGGGFFATPLAPLPDLLSTATALHALAGLHADLASIQEPCLDFVDSLWTNRGAFFGNWTDDEADVEYTYYGLLALGHLAL